MKTKVLTLMVVALCLFAACQKSEGEFDPAKKLSKLYNESVASITIGDSTQETSTGKYLIEKWTWSGDKLTRIDYHNLAGDREHSDVFTYDGDVLVRTDLSDNRHTDFIYDGKKLSEIKNYEGDQLASEVVVTKRDGKKITEMTATTYIIYHSNSKSTHQLQNALQMLMPESAAECIATAAEKHVATKDDERITNITFTWTDNNITKIEVTDAWTSMYMVYSYDNKMNSTKGLIDYINGYVSMNQWGSKNNSVHDSIVAFDNGEMIHNSSVHFTYEYDGDWPVTRTYNTSSSYISATTIRYYEYED